MPLDLRVTRISWERIHLTLRLAFAGDDVPAAVTAGEAHFDLVDRDRALPAVAKHMGGTEYEITINVTRFVGRKQIPDGTWRLVPVVDGVAAAAATFDLDAAADLDSHSRIFLYDGNRTSYTISFGLSEDDDRPLLLLRAYQMFRKGGRRPGLLKRIRRWPRKVASTSNKSKVLNWVYWTSRRLPRSRGRRILFASEQRNELGGNLLRIRDRMVERGLDKEFEFAYSFRTPATSDKISTLRAIYLLGRADFVFIDDYFAMLDSVKLAPDSTIVQVWHAGSGFKAVGYSRFGKYGSPRLSNAHRKYTYAITGSKHLVPVYAEVFGIEEGAVVPTGLPRIDTFLDPDRTRATVEAFYAENPDLRGKRLILFAPTFRGRGIRDAYYDYSRLDLDALYEYCGEDTVILFRMHHFVTEPVPIPPLYRDRMRDFSTFPDGNDLLHVVDLLVTDYSSIIYEYSLLRRPMLFFAYDKDSYASTRGFHRDYVETAPGKVCTTFDQFMEALRTNDFEEWRRDAFVEHNFDHVDTHSADRVIDWLILGRPIGSPVQGQDTIEAVVEEHTTKESVT